MDSKPLSQYFSDSEAPATSQFFDEIGTTPSDMIQSVYLGNSEGDQTITSNLFSSDASVSFTQQKAPTEVTFTNVLPTVSGVTTLPASSLPDPATFFDTIGPEHQLGTSKTTISPDILGQAMDGLVLKDQQVDKEADRRRDAWIPNEEAKKILMKAQSSPKGSFFPDREVLTMPGLILEEELADALQEIAVRYLGVGEAASRGVLRADHVSRDESGLRELMRTGYLRSAINLTGTLINACGQGVGRIGRPTKHTPRSLQLWLTRFAIMVRVRLHDPLVKEAEPFGDLSKPDLYYQFYPESYGNRSGSMVPFSLRLLLSELPLHLGKPEEAMNRLYAMLGIIKQMLTNLRDGKTEDGESPLTSDNDKTESVRLWTGREIRVQHSIVNCAIAMKDYRLAIKTVVGLTQYPEISIGQKRSLNSALCRLCLLSGHVKGAINYLEVAKEARNSICPTPDVREYVDGALVDISQGKYSEAYGKLIRAAEQEPTNVMPDVADVREWSSAATVYAAK
ncbi:Trafficking protein particle complex subunit 12 [Eumeta japonica]|uniref:Trafficking protein particle complex subunit 12 n=1 Tax=Eumeta variegata TaxID=151549 RepID=A0A4C1XYS5_EUMVA|nr:Trafficking protein particle complex subunit 12 [Eumeta japonica]